MAARGKKNNKPTRSFGKRFKDSPITTTVGELKKLGVPRWAGKSILLLTAIGATSPSLSAQANRIPLESTFTGLGANIRRRIMGLVR
jgi:hypothetical protein